MDVVDVDVVGAQPPQRRVDLLEDRPARQSLTGRSLMHSSEDLGSERDVLSARVSADCPADELLAAARLIRVRRVPERDSELHGLPEERLRCGLIEGPIVQPGDRVAVAHAAQPDAADLQIRTAEACGDSHGLLHPGVEREG